jgi:hypothetical protein
MKYLLLLLTLPTIANAEISNCGEYNARAIVRVIDSEMKIVVNEKTQSETVISMPLLEQGKIAGHIDKPVTIKLLLTKKFNGMTGVSDKILSTELRIPDPLKAMDTGLTLIKKMDCTKI